MKKRASQGRCDENGHELEEFPVGREVTLEDDHFTGVHWIDKLHRTKDQSVNNRPLRGETKEGLPGRRAQQ